MIKPDNFKADPLGWAGNQCGHMFICGAASLVVALIWFAVFNEYPIRWHLFAVISIGYLAIELPQNGKFWDTIEDITFVVGYGAAFFVFPFKEIEVGNPLLLFNPDAVKLPAVVLVVHFMVGLGIREYQRREVMS